MSETLHFHPTVEEAVETTGQDIGRIKDVDMAYDVAETMNYSLDRGMSPEVVSEQADDIVKEELAHRAVKNIVQVAADYDKIQDKAKSL